MFTGFCGMRLNTAGVVIGWVGAAFSLLAVIFFGMMLGNIDEIVKMAEDQMSNSNEKIDEQTIRMVLSLFLVIYLTLNVINLVASVLLVGGTIKERHLLLVPWLINSGIGMLLSIIYMLYYVAAAVSQSVPFEMALVWLIITGLNLTFHFIIWYTIYSLFKKLQSNTEQQRLLHVQGTNAYPQYTKI